MSQDYPPPTLRSILQAMADFKTDRSSLVRRPMPFRDTGICVIMVGPAAIRQCGPVCEQAAAMVADQCNPEVKGRVTLDDDLEKVFDRMEREHEWFLWFSMEKSLLCAMFVGGEVCNFLAPRLTEQNCLCKIEHNEND